MNARRALALVLLLVVAGLAAWWLLSDPTSRTSPTSGAERAAPDAAGGPVLEAPTTARQPRADPGARTDAAESASSPPPPAPPSAEHPASLRVVVRGAKKAPLAGAEVTLGPRTVATDEEGVARFDGLAQPRAKVNARAAGHLPMQELATAPLTANAEAHLEIELDPARALEGRVLNARTLAPLAGARVRSRGGGDTDFLHCSGGRESYGEAVTDAQGWFRLETLPLEWVATVWAEAKGYGRGEECVLLHAEGPRPRAVELRLPHGGWLTAVVRDPSGAPVAGATLRVFSEKEGDIWTDGARPYELAAWTAVATTDAEGRATVLALPFDTPMRALAQRRGDLDSEERAGLAATAADPEIHVDLRLRVGSALVVRAESPEGRPVADATVEVDGRPPEGAAPGASGSVTRFEGLAPGMRKVAVYARGYRPLETEVDLPEGGATERVFRMDPGSRVTGKVVDETGRPIADMRLFGKVKDADDHMSGTSASDGTFALAGVAGHSYVLRTFGNATHAPSAEVEVRAPAKDVVVTCVRLARVSVQLRAPPGHVLPSEVLVYAGNGDDGWSGSSYPVEDGRLEFPYPVEARRLRLEPEGFLRIERDLAAAPGTTPDLGEIPLDPGLVLEGLVVDADGAPIPGADVAGGSGKRARTDEHGRFRLQPLQREDVWFDVASDDHVGASRRIAAADIGVELRLVLQRGGILSGQVVLADGASAGARCLTVRRGTESPTYVESDVAGRFRMRMLPGAYRAAVGGPGSQPSTWIDAEVAEGKEVAITLRPPP